ncbi:MAG: GNAT family N-acetyltransferase [Saprospiraceae bacterium]|nr:GNAT family N-acetyltransferase [Saprospiraceae bacterium]
MEILLRKATLADMPAVYNLVYELAVYEKEPEALKIGVEAYAEAFSENLIDCVVAEKGTEIIGIALYYMTFSTWRGKSLYLEDFYVKPEHRNAGVGQQLFDAYLSEAKSRGALQTKWQVLDWNEPGINFYLKNNATIEKNWWNGKIYL